MGRGFLGLIRLHNSSAAVLAHSFDTQNGTTTGIILRIDEDEMKVIKKYIIHNRGLIGQRLFLRAILTNLSLKVSMQHLSEVKEDVMDIEHNTGQHTWDNYRPRDLKLKSDLELSRLAHGLRIQVAVLARKIEVASIWLQLLQDDLISTTATTASSSCVVYDFLQVSNFSVQLDSSTMLLPQWLRNLKTQIQLAKVDVELVGKRAEIQIGAQLFALPQLDGQPFWMYWIITTPLTIVVLGSWIYWTHWRIRSVEKQEMEMDKEARRLATEKLA
ncbi:uncharacterized protein KY384_004535 [Bacidia gigantensis]|uniref:uncharacterized protein n=1 Tax=Bacidia gigantensis TaxID=2732470 RepID=UPI001D043EF8|nr:uncharacterized protein KY384_004535 [Bacidia gigantensis]KAG8531177.1 hypothetical protein KY384_004535 [Bacidia gigantensis]